jgi:hypothetical protein
LPFVRLRKMWQLPDNKNSTKMRPEGSESHREVLRRKTPPNVVEPFGQEVVLHKTSGYWTILMRLANAARLLSTPIALALHYPLLLDRSSLRTRRTLHPWVRFTSRARCCLFICTFHATLESLVLFFDVHVLFFFWGGCVFFCLGNRKSMCKRFCNNMIPRLFVSLLSVSHT